MKESKMYSEIRRLVEQYVPIQNDDEAQELIKELYVREEALSDMIYARDCYITELKQ